MFLDPKGMARLLKKVYKNIKSDRYYISKETFRKLAGRKRNLRDRFLLDVNTELHKTGLTLVDLRKLRRENDYIAVIKTKKILDNWNYLTRARIKKLLDNNTNNVI